MTKFFHYRQRNSGGHYIGYKNIIIEALDYLHANTIFNNLDLDKSYCECCGERWELLDKEYDECHGDIEPMIANYTVEEYRKKMTYDICSCNAISLKIIYLNGETKKYGYNYKGEH